jgi:hypothetical protein
MPRLVGPGLLAAILALWWAPAGVAAGPGAIDGQVKNGTAGAGIAPGSQVVLHVVTDDQRVDRQVAPLDDAGRFSFEGLETGPSVKYLPSVEYGGTLYFARPLSLSGQQRQSVEITVYESTRTPQWIAFERSNLLIQGIATDRLDVMEMGALANAGDRTYLGPEAPAGVASPTLRFWLPSGAYDLAPQAGFLPNDVSVGQGGFTTSSPVTPGRHQLAYGYSLGFAGDRLELVKRLEYPTLNFNLYVPDIGLRVESAQLAPVGPAELGGQRFVVYSAQSLPAGTQLQVRLIGLPSSAPSGQALVWSVLGLGCVVLGIGVYAVYRRRVVADSPGGGGESIEKDPLELERMRLLLALASLDERYEQGDLTVEEYRSERERGKRRLVALGPRRSGAIAGGV